MPANLYVCVEYLAQLLSMCVCTCIYVHVVVFLVCIYVKVHLHTSDQTHAIILLGRMRPNIV
jgi:hypothetical protein